MKRLAGIFCAIALAGAVARGQSPVTITVDTKAAGRAIPDDFVGLSFGMKALPPDRQGIYLFSPENASLVALFREVGIRHLRLGGTTVESPPKTPIPDEAAIDNLFAFAKAAGVNKIIYSLRLLSTNADCHYEVTNARLAKYIWDHYRPQLEAFSIGNETDLQRVFKQDYIIRDFPTYISQWHKFAVAIAEAAPGAKFAGPDGAGNVGWSEKFCKTTKGWGLVSELTLHYYAGGKGRGVSPEVGIQTMLSAQWPKNYEKLYKSAAAMAGAAGIPFRFTESNDHYSGGITNASDTFAGALWALDYLHWWAAHDAQGVDFHNTQWVVSDIVTPREGGGFRVNPKAYGLKAFDLGAHGTVTPVQVAKDKNLDLTAYAVRGPSAVFVTVINKEFGAGAKDAEVTLSVPGSGKNAATIFLTAPGNDVTTKTGVTLGGGTISDAKPWQGEWKPLDGLKLAVPRATAVVVKIPNESL